MALRITVMLATAPRTVQELALELPDGATVRDACTASGGWPSGAAPVPGQFVGVWGRKAEPDQPRFQIAPVLAERFLIEQLLSYQANAFGVADHQAIALSGLVKKLVELHALVDHRHDQGLEQTIVGSVASSARKPTRTESNRARPGSMNFSKVLLMAGFRLVDQRSDELLACRVDRIAIIASIGRRPLEP